MARKTLYDEIQGYERKLICDALIRAQGNQAHAGRLLGLRPTTLLAHIRRLGIDVPALCRPSPAAPGVAFLEEVRHYERKLICDALAGAAGNQAAAAKALGLGPTTLHSRIRRLGIDMSAFRRSDTVITGVSPCLQEFAADTGKSYSRRH